MTVKQLINVLSALKEEHQGKQVFVAPFALKGTENEIVKVNRVVAHDDGWAIMLRDD